MKSPLPGRWWATFLVLSVILAVAVGLFLWSTVGNARPSLSACPPACPYEFNRPSTLLPASIEQGYANFLYNLILVLAIGVFVTVEGLIIYTIYRFRNRPPESAIQTHGNTKLEIAWTIAPAVVLIVIMGFSLQAMAQIRGPSIGEVLRVKAIGHQFWWEFQYPVQKGIAKEIITASELVVPEDVTVEVEMESVDVEHGFWAPELFGKVDAIPGYTTRLKFTPTQVGKREYGGQCTQYCGVQHAQMRFSVIVVPRAEFESWVAAHQKPAASVETLTGNAAAGAAAFVDAQNACIACHVIDGVPQAVGKIGPNLTHLMSRAHIAGGVLENNPENLARWLRDPQGVKPGNKMVIRRLDEKTVNDLVAYLTTLK
ncbi:MAG: cytochrome c oxidase subunit II [Anaerolineales bacterium]|nr:cytochrome c oxidase subunit II [Anaerolineales bacterium]